MAEREKKFHFDNLNCDEPLRYGALCIWQIGDLYCNGGYQVSPHIQTCHELSYVAAGTGTFTLNGKSYRVRSGQVFLSPMGSEHAIRSGVGNPLRYYYCGFRLDESHPDCRIYRDIERLFLDLKEPLAVDQCNLHNVFAMLFNELSFHSDNSDVLVKAGLDQLLFLTHRCFLKATEAPTTKHPSDNFKNRLVSDVIYYIDSHLFSMKNLTDISDHLGYSYSYISQLFSETMGVGLKSYFQEQRFSKAAELMQRHISITQIAEMLGFDSASSFSRSFKKRYGMSPSAYGERAENKTEGSSEKELSE